MKTIELKLKEYYDYFGESFIFNFGETKVEAEIIQEIDDCIR